MSATLPDGIVQMHVTARCNLRCAMCYSSSGPERGEALPLALACAAVDDAAAAGYHTLSISGGEPTLYRELIPLLKHARTRGLATQMVSHGMGIDAARARTLAPLLDRLAISIDGIGTTHDRSRGRAGSFARMQRGLQHAHDAGIPTALLVTVTRENLAELDALFAFALDAGAQALQLHPIERAGRAQTGCEALMLDERDRARLFFWFHVRRAQAAGRLAMQLDLPSPASRGFEAPSRRPVLVIGADGGVMLLAHRDGARERVGQLHDAPLRDVIARYAAAGTALLRDVQLASLMPHWDADADPDSAI
jgi:Fe-coproporphyrin III synthase